MREREEIKKMLSDKLVDHLFFDDAFSIRHKISQFVKLEYQRQPREVAYNGKVRFRICISSWHPLL